MISKNISIILYWSTLMYVVLKLSTVSISNCRYQEAPGEVVWSECTDRYEGQEERVDQAMAPRTDWK